ncbi:MAG: hypothetical protein OXL97_10380 [Chloroflexota bacterium]|nr:hypothetical protein [Chloroflexota bacterium]MDE2886187.1 hypothetical protein [Chloroflexota bacterium]
MVQDGATIQENADHGDANASPPVPAQLTPRQMLAIPYIVSAPSLRRGAQAARIGRNTLTRWMQDPNFRAEIGQARRHVPDLAFAEINGLALKGAIALADLLEDPDPRVRNAAVRIALQHSLKLKEIAEVRDRMDIMDYAFSMLKGQRGAR